MTPLNILLLSALQGLTEFLPVSSSGHLILFSKFTSFPDQGLALDIAVHIGSIFAVLIYFHKDIWQIAAGIIKSFGLPNFKNLGNRLFYMMLIGTIPAIIAGVLLKKYGMEELRDTRIIGWNILIFGILLFIADKTNLTIRRIEHMTLLDAFLIGLAQCLALIPGTSRSGITITMGRFLSLERREAAKFSMLLSIPAILGAGLLVGYELYSENNFGQILDCLEGIGYSFLASLFAIYFIMWWLKKSTYLPFVIYRILLGSYLLLHSYGVINF